MSRKHGAPAKPAAATGKFAASPKTARAIYAPHTLSAALSAREPEPALIERAVTALVDARIEAALAGRTNPVAPAVRLPNYPPEQLGGGLERAYAEGEIFKRTELGRPFMLSGEEAAKRAGLTRQALDDRRKAGTALAVAHIKRGYKYPAWQFSDRLAEPLAALWPILKPMDSWGKYLFFIEREPLVGGRTPLEALEAGEHAAVIRAARAIVDEYYG